MGASYEDGEDMLDPRPRQPAPPIRGARSASHDGVFPHDASLDEGFGRVPVALYADDAARVSDVARRSTFAICAEVSSCGCTTPKARAARRSAERAGDIDQGGRTSGMTLDRSRFWRNPRPAAKFGPTADPFSLPPFQAPATHMPDAIAPAAGEDTATPSAPSTCATRCLSLAASLAAPVLVSLGLSPLSAQIPEHVAASLEWRGR